jgi:hypothetical protein
MFHELVNETMDAESGQNLQLRLKNDGYILVDGSFSDLEKQDILDAWSEYYSGGPEAAVDYLETSFGLYFEKR